MYARNTSVPVERSQQEIKKILTKYQATAFMFAENQTGAMVAFELKGRRIKFNLPMPPPQGNSPKMRAGYEQKCRSRWRSLVLGIKAKLECVESGITTIDQEFLAHIVLPDGRTFGDIYIPQIDAAYQSKELPPLLGGNV